ncbi:MAG: insulinase family protein, partial [Syntrophomonadaceae bacterium]|nr:insulinase family protein [Syntrophomonadaceae bacterium]
MECWVLEGGMKLVLDELPHVRSAAIGVYVRAGSRDEDEACAGVSHFLEHMLFKGTATRSARDIAEFFESVGGQLNAYTSKEYTCYYARCLDEDFGAAMEVLLDLVFASALRERDVATEKGVVMEEIGLYEDTPDELVHDVFARVMWPSHPLGRPILGTRASIAGLEPEVLRSFYRHHYQPHNLVVAVAGHVDGREVRERLAGLVRPVERRAVPIRGAAPVPGGPARELVAKDTEQVQLVVGVPGIDYHDGRRFAQMVANSILGGGMSSRLFQSIREEQGLAYSVYSMPSSYSDAGAFAIGAGISPERADEFFALLAAELSRFVEMGPTAEEVERAHKQIKAGLLLGMESVMTRMTRLG